MFEKVTLLKYLPSILLEVRRRPLKLRSNWGAALSIGALLVWKCVLPEYRNLDPRRGKKPALFVGSGVANLEKAVGVKKATREMLQVKKLTKFV